MMGTIKEFEREAVKDLPKLLFNIKETAYMLGVSEKSVRRFLERGLLKSSPVLRIKLIPRQSIEAFTKITG